MGRLFTSFLAGCLFGAGLLISQMTNPSKVIAFLDIFGNWDPSLAFVMLSALLITFFGYRWVLKREKPVFDQAFGLPTRRDLDGRLILGAGLFGIGWGLSGLCPGPAISVSTFGEANIVYFLSGLIGTIAVYQLINMRQS